MRQKSATKENKNIMKIQQQTPQSTNRFVEHLLKNTDHARGQEQKHDAGSSHNSHWLNKPVNPN
jgi:hypothetical protein